MSDPILSDDTYAILDMLSEILVELKAIRYSVKSEVEIEYECSRRQYEHGLLGPATVSPTSNDPHL